MRTRGGLVAVPRARRRRERPAPPELARRSSRSTTADGTALPASLSAVVRWVEEAARRPTREDPPRVAARAACAA
jgi:hypothetical protein